MNQTSSVKAERARENGAYVRMLLRERQPAFAAALAFAEQHCPPPAQARPARRRSPQSAGRQAHR
jgi:hypothetical protein